MAATKETLQLAARLDLIVRSKLSGSQAQMANAWARTWRVVQSEWADLARQVALDVAEGRTPTRRTLARLRNVRAAAAATQQALEELIGMTGGLLVDDVLTIAQQTAAAQHRLIASQLPPGLALGHEGVPNRQLEQIVRRTTQQITSALRPLSAEATESMIEQLLTGAVRGQNPRDVARQMLREINGAFNGGYARALNVARTELLDAHRQAAAATQAQYDDVLAGWQWLAHLTTRTCPACWGMHGTTHRLDEPGPAGHQQCRCSRVPKTRSWADLGIPIEEPRSLIIPGNQAFAALPNKDQLEIMGPTRLAALKSGTADWSELAQLKHNSGWRDAYYVRPVSDFRPRMNQTA
jgi:SPP1 gp7 family putative phage head morphogenesis protein